MKTTPVVVGKPAAPRRKSESRGGRFISMDDAKTNGVPGMQFIGKNGVIGTILNDTNPNNRFLASFTCEVPGCTEQHIRQVADWHQVSKCRTHAAKRTRKSTQEN